MHTSKDELEPMVLEPVELLELSPVAEHDRTMAIITHNLGLVRS